MLSINFVSVNYLTADLSENDGQWSLESLILKLILAIFTTKLTTKTCGIISYFKIHSITVSSLLKIFFKCDDFGELPDTYLENFPQTHTTSKQLDFPCTEISLQISHKDSLFFWSYTSFSNKASKLS